MIAKKYLPHICTLVFSLLFLDSIAQYDSLERKFFNNDSIKYNLTLVTAGVYNRDQAMAYYVSIILPKDFAKFLKTQNVAFWSKRIMDDKSDWATNLILYYLNQKDASLLMIYDSREKWLQIKDNEIDSWKQFLQSRSL
ncbi:MAG: hypothetical protein ABI861_01385 [Panacibacter sp.]